MAKGGSEFAVQVLEGQEVAGEHRRAVANALCGGGRGAGTAGVDGRTAFYVSAVRGEEGFLADLGAELKARRFRPLPVAERLIPKPGGSKRRLGIPTVADRAVQAALKLVLEPIF